MNCSTTADIQHRFFLSGNFGASVFMATYIGFYGMGLIVYFSCNFMTDSRDNHDGDISNEFFLTFHHITDRQKIYNQLTDKNWITQVYKIYYSDEPLKSEMIEEKANQCAEKYLEKIQNLQSRHTYYITETSTPPPLSTITCIV